jgi:hypothetical protein
MFTSESPVSGGIEEGELRGEREGWENWKGKGKRGR